MTKDQTPTIRPVAATDEVPCRELWHETIHAGRTLYDRVGAKTPLMVYERVV